ncbi:MAG: hypothetical protein ACK5KU_04030 [Beutenbergiaceae bacterium]
MSTIRDFISRHRSNLALWSVVLGSFAVGYRAYMLRLPTFYPDSRYYLAMAFLFGGESPESARDLTVEWAARFDQDVPELEKLFGWGLVQPRVILPLLSAIPVRIFGPPGLAGTVLGIFLVLTVVLTLILRARFGNATAISIMLLLNTSHYLMMFNGGMLTESLSALWSALTLVVAWWWIRRRRRWMLLMLVGLVTAAAFTRQATFIVAGAFVIAWLLGSAIQRRWNEWTLPAIVVATTALGVQILQSLLFPSFSQMDQFLMKAGADTLGEALLAAPQMGLLIFMREVNTFLHQDVPLLVLICLAIASTVLFIRRTESHLLIGTVLGIALYNITNGTPTQFRYAIPGLIFFALSAAVLVSRAAQSATVDEASPGEDPPESTALEQSTGTEEDTEPDQRKAPASEAASTAGGNQG